MCYMSVLAALLSFVFGHSYYILLFESAFLLDSQSINTFFNFWSIVGHVYDGSASIHVARHVSSGHYLSVKKVDLDMLDREESGLGSLHVSYYKFSYNQFYSTKNNN